MVDVTNVETGRISTHALTWSATNKNYGEFIILKISTHALTWSATSKSAIFI